MDRLFEWADRVNGGRWQWPCWLLEWAWQRQATPYIATGTKRKD